ncbi:MAG: hypothetical protein ACHQAZ_07725 [Gammaproteobacteria bacterium]
MSSINNKHLAATLLLAAAALTNLTAHASDDFNIYSPYVTAGQSEVEIRGHQTTDSDPALQGERANEISIAHAFTSWWRPEGYLGMYERQPGSANTYVGHEFENVFQLTDAGEYWADFGFLASYEYKSQPGDVSTLEFGPLFEKQTGHIRQRLNFIWEKQLGSGAEHKYEFRSAYLMTYNLGSGLAPGFEAYYRPSDQSRQLGPALYGEIPTSRGNEFEFSTALLFDLNKGAPNRTLALRLEYEFN